MNTMLVEGQLPSESIVSKCDARQSNTHLASLKRLSKSSASRRGASLVESSVAESSVVVSSDVVYELIVAESIGGWSSLVPSPKSVLIVYRSYSKYPPGPKTQN